MESLMDVLTETQARQDVGGRPQARAATRPPLVDGVIPCTALCEPVERASAPLRPEARPHRPPGDFGFASDAPLISLPPRMREVMALLVDGCSEKEVAL